MKFNNIFKYVSLALAAGTLAGVTSCNYLDVVPPEQASLEDAMKTHDDALGFLYSCYNGLTDENQRPGEYVSSFCASTDEYILPNPQESAYPQVFAAMKNTQTTDLSNICHLWGSMYRYIGQCLLFEEQLITNGRDNGVCINADEEAEWLAETRFLKAYYHFALLRVYGPIPLTTERIEMSSPSDAYNGRFHFDYCVRYLANEFYEAAKVLPPKRESNYFGRATSVMAMAMRARLLLYAASDLWNGKFPYPEWKNVNFETPGYGRELVARTYDKSKWERALKATEEAIELAENNGYKLMETYNPEENVTLESMAWVPVDFENDAEKNEFLTKVMLNRYIHTTSQSENPEIIWSIKYQRQWCPYGRMPLKIIKNKDNQWYATSYSVVNPTLNTAYGFLCKDGRLPMESHPGIDFSPKSDWFKAMNGAAEGHEDIINLMRNREPRFYAWIAFDGGNYLNRIKNGGPLTLNFKSAKAQGFDQANEPKNYASTGLLTMKFLNPVTSISDVLNYTGGIEVPTVMMRLSELYLNRAECHAALSTGEDDQHTIDARKDINKIRKRAGAENLRWDQIGSTVNNAVTGRPKLMTITEWVRQERFIELWDEGHRYFDIRRWVAGPEYLGAGVRQGLTGDTSEPTFEEFNTPKNPNPAFAFSNRQYLYPIFINEVYKNPQMVQAPGF